MPQAKYRGCSTGYVRETPNRPEREFRRKVLYDRHQKQDNMSNILSRVGIGSATVDTIVPPTITAGGTIDASVEIEGGSSDQQIDAIYFALETRYKRSEGNSVAVIDQFQLTDSFTIEAGTEQTLDVDIEIPRYTPITLDWTKVWIDTGLDIDWALDPDDTDHIEVEPTDRMQRVFDAVEELGFDLRTARPERKPGDLFSTERTFVQEFEFVPKQGPYRGEIEEIELIFDPSTEKLDVRLEVDRRVELLTELSDTDLDEQFEQIIVTDEPASDIADDIQHGIETNR